MYSTCPEQCVHYRMKHFERLAARFFLRPFICIVKFVFHLLFVHCSLSTVIYPLISKYLFTASPLNMSTEEKMEVDNRSIYVGNVSENA
jgi:hypothetical protein